MIIATLCKKEVVYEKGISKRTLAVNEWFWNMMSNYFAANVIKIIGYRAIIFSQTITEHNLLN